MADKKLVIDYKLFFEADDIAQTRILSSESYIKKSLAAHKNPYIAIAEPDSETDLDEFLLRLYYAEHIEEEEYQSHIWTWKEVFRFHLKENSFPIVLFQKPEVHIAASKKYKFI